MTEDAKRILLRDAYTELFVAATILEATTLTVKDVQNAMYHATIATAKLTSLERYMAGVPEPKTGEQP